MNKLMNYSVIMYRKIPKNSNIQNIAVIILKFEQCGSTIK